MGTQGRGTTPVRGGWRELGAMLTPHAQSASAPPGSVKWLVPDGPYNPRMSLDRKHLAADAGFWPAAARSVIEFAEDQGAPERQFHSLTWIVATGAQAVSARAAMREAIGPRAFLPPRIEPLEAWLGLPRGQGTGPRLELFSALRANRWILENIGANSATLWALARDIGLLCDELTLAAVDSAEAFDARLRDSLARHFRMRAARALQAPALLVLQLWRARNGADDGAARFVRELAARSENLVSPLVYLGTRLSSHGTSFVERWETAFLERAARQASVLHLVADVAVATKRQPLIAAAWPELCSEQRPAPIAQRADEHIRTIVAPPLTLLPAATLEETAGAVARQTVAWLREGIDSIALVALDRLAARRVRALLERAEVVVQDETGWRLSTTSAAAVVMRWFDLVQDDLYWRDLLDWLKSSFTLADRSAKAREVALLEHAIRAGGAVQGAQAMRRALAEVGAAGDECRDGAQEVLGLIEARMQATLRMKPALLGHAQDLRQTLITLGMTDGLAADPVGRAVLGELDGLERDLAQHRGAGTLADFRALLALRFEEASFVDRTVKSPVAMVSLAASALRRFDAAALIGVDAAHLPTAPSDVLFMSNAVRAELGLATAADALRDQAAQLASLLATTPRIIATWQAQADGEPNVLSPLLQRLQFVCQRALGDNLLRATPAEEFEVAADLMAVPRPRAPQLLPRRIAAGHAQSLVDCPYQFFARRMLRLAEPDDVVEVPDKRDFGIALHDVLQRFHREWRDADFNQVNAADLAASLRAQSRAVFAPQLERLPGLLAYERRFAGLVDGYVEWLQRHSREGWRWNGSEDSYRQLMPLDDERSVELGGRVDRIDVAADGRVHLLDYKARDASTLKRALSQRGEDIQLPFYGLLLPRRPDSAQYLCFDRVRDGVAGVETVTPPGAFDALMEAVSDRLRADLRRVADGAALPAIGAETVCARCEMRGLCRRDHWNTTVAETDGSS
jgi:ATP-dependent helicase/nuclease subunit B